MQGTLVLYEFGYSQLFSDLKCYNIVELLLIIKDFMSFMFSITTYFITFKLFTKMLYTACRYAAQQVEIFFKLNKQMNKLFLSLEHIP